MNQNNKESSGNEPNAPSAATSRENAAPALDKEPASGELADAPCSASSGASDKQDSRFRIDFFDAEGNQQDGLVFAVDVNPLEDTNKLSLLINRSLALFGVKAFSRITPGKLGGVVKGKSNIILQTGQKLEFDIIDLLGHSSSKRVAPCSAIRNASEEQNSENLV